VQGIAVQESTAKRYTVLLVAAFAAVYIFWGSTYLAIKYAIETIPPFLMAGSRFVIAGVILLTWARFTKDYEKPKAVHWRTAIIIGTLLLLGGNGGVVFAERHISSSLAALLVAVEPFWVVLLSWLWLGNKRPSLKVVAGLLAGFLGVWLLISGHPAESGSNSSDSMRLIGSFVVVAATVCWALGSVYGLKASVPKSSIQSAGMQMFSGGIVLLVFSIFTGDWQQFDAARISSNSIFGVIYLIVFGSLLGFTAYSWLLKNAAPSMVATYAYVNPVIAVILGWLIAGETFTGQMLVGAGVIVGSVVLITSQGKSSKEDEVEDEDIGTSAGAAASASA
jgi:drug/metabolite transporter (DMT)-like permease